MGSEQAFWHWGVETFSYKKAFFPGLVVLADGAVAFEVPIAVSFFWCSSRLSKEERNTKTGFQY